MPLKCQNVLKPKLYLIVIALLLTVCAFEGFPGKTEALFWILWTIFRGTVNWASFLTKSNKYRVNNLLPKRAKRYMIEIPNQSSFQLIQSCSLLEQTYLQRVQFDSFFPKLSQFEIIRSLCWKWKLLCNWEFSFLNNELNVWEQPSISSQQLKLLAQFSNTER